MYKYPHDISEKLLEKITQSQLARFSKFSGDPNETEQLKTHITRIEPIPSSSHIRELFDVTFFSSLSQEEGEAVKFSITYIDPITALDSKWPHVQFSNHLPLSIEHIRKLSPASPHDYVYIATFPKEGELRIWGLIYRAQKNSYPSGLTITSQQTGSFSVRFSNELQLSYTRGEAIIYDPIESIDRTKLSQLIASVFADTKPFSDKYKIASILLDIGSEALLSGSGGTLLIVPQNHELKGLDTSKFSINEASRQNLETLLPSDVGRHITPALAQLLSIDGAVVYEEGSGFIGAGAMIQMDDPHDFKVHVMLPHQALRIHTETTLKRFNGGARHRSALAFCYANPGALAVVISQDGVMSILVRSQNDNCVVAIRPIRLGTLLSQ